MSELLTLACPNCEATLKVKPPSGEGKKTRCPKCSEVFVVEPPDEEAEPEEETAVTTKPKKRPAPVVDSDDDDEADESKPSDQPRKKKKKKKQKEKIKPPSNRLILGMVAGGVAFMLLFGGVSIWLMMRGGGAAIPPGTHEHYDSEDFEFGLTYPADWKMKGGGIQNHRFVEFEKGKAMMSIHQSLAGSLKGDIAGAGVDANAPDDRQPFARVHEMKKQEFAEEIGDNYKEQPPETILTKGFGKARRSGFSTSALFKKTRGYRVTVLATMTSYDIICRCPEGDWETQEPVFDKVLKSFGPGGGK